MVGLLKQWSMEVEDHESLDASTSETLSFHLPDILLKRILKKENNSIATHHGVLMFVDISGTAGSLLRYQLLCMCVSMQWSRPDRYKWSGGTIYGSIGWSGGHLCHHVWSSRTHLCIDINKWSG